MTPKFEMWPLMHFAYTCIDKEPNPLWSSERSLRSHLDIHQQAHPNTDSQSLPSAPPPRTRPDVWAPHRCSNPQSYLHPEYTSIFTDCWMSEMDFNPGEISKDSWGFLSSSVLWSMVYFLDILYQTAPWGHRWYPCLSCSFLCHTEVLCSPVLGLFVLIIPNLL